MENDMLTTEGDGKKIEYRSIEATKVQTSYCLEPNSAVDVCVTSGAIEVPLTLGRESVHYVSGRLRDHQHVSLCALFVFGR
ncbi:hypothetical protein J6590_062362 [Homalodisca vitripennis]|nr:hypothetical protein J6590_062362 [Homalodisca vitripennis]